jgi:adenine-specific DNA-methyltransferase
MVEKLSLSSPNLTQSNIEWVSSRFPNVVTEGKDETGKLVHVVDFDALKQELSGNIVEGPQERYRLDWPGKREAMLAANTPITKTLRPVRKESVDFDNTGNLFIEGDNLDALKLLQETYLAKVKMIYIDPPYNTGKDFIYKDNFKGNKNEYLEDSGQVNEQGGKLVANLESIGRYHSNWLSMMYPRLKLARNLLRDDGVIFVSIDESEQANLKRMYDEIFGEKNFVGTMIWEKRYSPQNAVKWFSEAHDFILVYARNKLEWYPKLLPRSKEMNARYRNLDNDPRGNWKPADATAQGGHGTKSQFYVVTAPNGKTHSLPNGRCWVYTEPVFQKMVEDNRIWFGADGNNVPAVKRFLSEVKQGTACQTIWKYNEVGHNQEGKKEVNSLFPEASVFDTPKPVRLIKRILHLSTNADSIVLDFFSGSSTTAHAVMQINAERNEKRKSISVQLPEKIDKEADAFLAGWENIAEISKERIRRSGQKILEENPNQVGKLDVGFRVLKIDSSNMNDVYYSPSEVAQSSLLDTVEHIKPDRTSEDLLFQVMLDWGVELSLPIVRETIEDKMVFWVGENALAACFEMNVTENLVKTIASRKPLRVVFRDDGFSSDDMKINADQLFKQMTDGHTDMKVV